MSYLYMPSKAIVEQQKRSPVQKDKYGNKLPDIAASVASTITHKCMGGPLSTTEKIEHGVTVSEVYYKLIAEVTWSGGMNSKVTFDGRSFEQVGEAEFHKRNPLTQHAEVLLKAVESNPR